MRGKVSRDDFWGCVEILVQD